LIVAVGLPKSLSYSKNSSRTARRRPTRSITMSTPQFWSTPLRYIRWASHEKPAIFYSLIIGSMGPVALVTLPPLRRALGDVDPEPIPMTYPSKLANPPILSATAGMACQITNCLLETNYNIYTQFPRVRAWFPRATRTKRKATEQANNEPHDNIEGRSRLILP
jgi:hypothetical protein